MPWLSSSACMTAERMYCSPPTISTAARYASAFYAEAYRAAVDIVGGEQYILSAVMHADELNQGMSKALGYDVWHYHLHVVYAPTTDQPFIGGIMALLKRRLNRTPPLSGASAFLPK